MQGVCAGRVCRECVNGVCIAHVLQDPMDVKYCNPPPAPATPLRHSDSKLLIVFINLRRVKEGSCLCNPGAVFNELTLAVLHFLDHKVAS